MAGTRLRFTRIDPLSPWLPVCTGLFAAELAAAIVCELPQHLRLPALIVRAVKCLFVTAAIGYGGLMLPRLFSRRPYPLPPRTLALLCLPGWLFLPPVVVLYREHSVWLLPVVAAAVVTLTLSLQRIAFLETPVEYGPASRPGAFASRNAFASLDGLPAPEYHPGTKFLIATSVIGALALAANHLLAFAALTLAGGIVLATWRWIDLTRFMPRRRPRPAQAHARLAASAAVLTLWALALWSSGSGEGNGMGHTKPPPPLGAEGGSGAGYLGVILLPPDVEKKDIVAPVPHAPMSFHIGLGHPVVIPFDGPYWYFKSPHKDPGKGAHVARGKSTEVNIHSTDFAPLQMEAHQRLPAPVDLNCCSGIDLAVTNADNRPGVIAVALRLTDTLSPSHPFQILPFVPLLSSDIQQIIPHRQPVEESLHFTIPRPSALLRFNEIAVVFYPDPIRSRIGARVAVKNFTLIPR